MFPDDLYWQFKENKMTENAVSIMDISGNLKAAMKQFAANIDQMEKDPEVIEATKKYDELFEAMLKAQEIGDKLREKYQVTAKELEEYIIAQVLELGTSASHAGVEAKHRAGYERVTWNNKEMTSLCMKNPALLDLLASARKITEVDPSVKISYTPEPAEEPVEAPF